jgi:GH25 family lysozyme M1 (1,4-beta-N-acetylmuramidase)
VTLPGIDVSAIGQGAGFNWGAWKGKIAFAGIKATQGLSFEDPDYSRNMSGAFSIGAARMSYHLLDPTVSGEEQADYYLKYAKPQPGELAMLDHELFKDAAGEVLAPAAVANCAAAFSDRVRGAVSAWPVLYTTQWMAENGYCEGLGQQPLFVANPSRIQLPPVIGPWRLVSFAQIGQRGVDTDVFYGTAQELMRLAVLHSPIPLTPEKVKGWRLSWPAADKAPQVLELVSSDGGKTWQE